MENLKINDKNAKVELICRNLQETLGKETIRTIVSERQLVMVIDVPISQKQRLKQCCF